MHDIAYCIRFKLPYRIGFLEASSRVSRPTSALANFKESSMQKISVATGALVFRFVLTSATALAQKVNVRIRLHGPRSQKDTIC